MKITCFGQIFLHKTFQNYISSDVKWNSDFTCLYTFIFPKGNMGDGGGESWIIGSSHRVFRAVEILSDTIMMDTCHTFVQPIECTTQRVNPIWTLGDYDVDVGSPGITNIHHCGRGCQ